ncbi:hypothetical protein JB92DRAFT_3045821 [Gautieria morchelliformis]|nr:hypothetical protein JB92DRAFT_3045821 [Gautieria morchelliformis]
MSVLELALQPKNAGIFVALRVLVLVSAAVHDLEGAVLAAARRDVVLIAHHRVHDRDGQVTYISPEVPLYSSCIKMNRKTHFSDAYIRPWTWRNLVCVAPASRAGRYGLGAGGACGPSAKLVRLATTIQTLSQGSADKRVTALPTLAALVAERLV